MNAHSGPRRPGVLVVDNELVVRAVLELGLRKEGFAVWLAGDGPEAVDVCARLTDQIDVVLLEVRLPRWDGPQTLAALRAINSAIRFCFMSGLMFGDCTGYTEAELLGLGGEMLFHKPFGTLQVAQALWKMLGRPHRGPHWNMTCPSVPSWGRQGSG